MKPLPTPRTIRALFPLSPNGRESVQKGRLAVKEIFERKSCRVALVVGPCSIHSAEEALEYGLKLKALQAQVDEQFLLVMRVHFEKPRTITGWKGLVYDPHLDASHEIEVGIEIARTILTSLADMGIPTSTEFLDPLLVPYFEDAISWGFIGARTSTSQIHRQLASTLSMPVGIKNGVDGAIRYAIDAVESSMLPHAFLAPDLDGKLSTGVSGGNPYAHLVLRGSDRAPNYSADQIQETLDKLLLRGLPERIVIDCAHGNSRKCLKRQAEIFKELTHTVLTENLSIFGLMLESHLRSGSQSLSGSTSLLSGVSITDPCLGWDETESLILEASSVLKGSSRFLLRSITSNHI